MLDLFSTVRDILRINADSWMHRLECYIYKCHVTFSNLSSSLGLFLFSRIPLSRPQAHEWQWLHSTPCRTVRYLEDKTLGYYHLYPIYICRTYVCRQFTYLELFSMHVHGKRVLLRFGESPRPSLVELQRHQLHLVNSL
jgi:hypothetical protein